MEKLNCDYKGEHTCCWILLLISSPGHGHKLPMVCQTTFTLLNLTIRSPGSQGNYGQQFLLVLRCGRKVTKRRDRRSRKICDRYMVEPSPACLSEGSCEAKIELVVKVRLVERVRIKMKVTAQ